MPILSGDPPFDPPAVRCYKSTHHSRGAVAQLGARLDGIEEVVGSNPIGSTIYSATDNQLFNPNQVR